MNYLLPIFCALLTAMPCLAKEVRIVSLDPALTEIIYLLGAEESLVGVTRHCNFPEQVKSKAIIGDYNSPLIEKILSLNPTHVVALSSGRPGLEKRLSKQSINLVQLQAKSLDDYKSNLKNLAKLLNKNPNTEIARFDQQKLILKNMKLNKSYIALLGNSPIVGVAKNSFLSQAFKICGLDNALSSKRPWPILSREKFLTQNSSLIIELGMGPNDMSSLKKSHKALHPKSTWLKMESDKILRLGPRLLSGVSSLCRLAANTATKTN